jgi:glycosyltransferase involved in cell wall biosynthesis
MPKVSIGFPVFNGERYLAEAIESMVSQSFTDLEIIICDNASTDGTETICRSFMNKDSRIRYHRNTLNLGPAINFNLSFKLSCGEYFKWAAHDDICAPDFLARCVEVMDRNIGVVLAYPKAMIIDADGKEIEPYDFKLPTDSKNPVERFNALLRGHKCFEVFGLIRRDALLKTRLIGAHAHGDGVLLSRLALLGRFEEIPEYLFYSRYHPEQSMAIMKKKKGSPTSEEYQQYAVWFNPDLSGKKVFPYWRISYEYFRAISTAPINIRNQISCYRCLAKWIYTRRYLFRGDIILNARRLRHLKCY